MTDKIITINPNSANHLSNEADRAPFTKELAQRINCLVMVLDYAKAFKLKVAVTDSVSIYCQLAVSYLGEDKVSVYIFDNAGLEEGSDDLTAVDSHDLIVRTNHIELRPSLTDKQIEIMTSMLEGNLRIANWTYDTFGEQCVKMHEMVMASPVYRNTYEGDSDLILNFPLISLPNISEETYKLEGMEYVYPTFTDLSMLMQMKVKYAHVFPFNWRVL